LGTVNAVANMIGLSTSVVYLLQRRNRAHF